MLTHGKHSAREDPESDENELEEPEDACLRRELGLRPHAFSDDPDRASQPDQRPCPSWCWVGQHPIYGHEMDWSHAMEATHALPASPAVVASLYPGDPAFGPADSRFIRAATIEPRLNQLGQSPPTVNVAFRRFEGREQVFDDEYLKLTITDARELVVAPNYLIELAERG